MENESNAERYTSDELIYFLIKYQHYGVISVRKNPQIVKSHQMMNFLSFNPGGNILLMLDATITRNKMKNSFFQKNIQINS